MLRTVRQVDTAKPQDASCENEEISQELRGPYPVVSTLIDREHLEIACDAERLQELESRKCTQDSNEQNTQNISVPL